MVCPGSCVAHCCLGNRGQPDQRVGLSHAGDGGDTDRYDSSINPATVGTISITGASPDKPSVAAFLDALAKVPGLVNPYLTSVTTLGTANQFTVQVGFTSALYQGRYTPAAK